MKLLIALAFAAAPSSLAMAPYVPIDDPTSTTIVAEGNVGRIGALTEFFLAVADTCSSIADISMEFKITHTCLEDLDVFLVGPSGAIATLATAFTHPAYPGDTYLGGCGLVATDGVVEGTWGTSFNPGTVSGPCGSSRPCVPEDGPYKDMDDFLGDEGTGTWTLMIDDTFVPYPGNLEYWRIKLTCEASGDESTS